MSVAEALRDLEFEVAGGARQSLGALWAEQPVVLVFLRHFG